jgi:hypothetical protein
LPSGERRYDSGRLLVVPAPAHTVPGVSAQQAIEAFEANWSTWHEYGPPEAELMIGNGGLLFDTDYPTGSGGFTLTDRLVWVLTWHDVYGTIRGPKLPAGTREAIRRGVRFTGTGIVDATTAKVLGIWEHGEARGPLTGH